jgi:hypothetical protein
VRTPVKLISVCHAADIETWRTASKWISKFICADSYQLIVPDQDVDLFRRGSSACFVIHPESEILSRAKERIVARLAPQYAHRAGWYLQQFLKIAALKTLDFNDVGLLWDSDTIPLRPLSFVNENKLIFYTGTEFNRDYFLTSHLLTGIGKVYPKSFIAQCMPVRKLWVDELVRKVEEKFRVPWDEALIGLIGDGGTPTFSEYETLGSFIWSHYPEQMKFSHDRRWLRHGMSRIGKPENLTPAQMGLWSLAFDFASFERWDNKRIYSKSRRASFLAKKILFRLFCKLKALRCERNSY